MTRDDADATLPVAEALETLGVPYYLGGSVASSIHGKARSTQDVDIVADLKSQHVGPFAARLESDYYADEGMMLEAIRHASSFNLIHFATGFKVDVFIGGSRPYDRERFKRVVRARPFEQVERDFPLASPEDVILKKLEWYRVGGEMSERQWMDVVEVIRMQDERLDRAYLTKWAASLNVSDLLERAFDDAVIED